MEIKVISTNMSSENFDKIKLWNLEFLHHHRSSSYDNDAQLR